jgi:hypothetical protein
MAPARGSRALAQHPEVAERHVAGLAARDQGLEPSPILHGQMLIFQGLLAVTQPDRAATILAPCPMRVGEVQRPAEQDAQSEGDSTLRFTPFRLTDPALRLSSSLP